MPVQDRPTEHLIKTGDYFTDSCLNLCEVIKREQKEDPEQELTLVKRVIEVVPEDLIIIPGLPLITCSFVGHQEKATTVGKQNVTHKLQITVQVHYYHEELNEQLRKSEITQVVWELTRIIRRNSDLNGLSPLGVDIVNSLVMNRQRANGTYAGARLELVVPVILQSRRATS